MLSLLKLPWKAILSASANDTIIYRTFIYAKLIKTLVEIYKPDIIIDIGGGRSYHLYILKDLANRTLAIDIDVSALRENPAADKIVADANLLPLRISTRRILVVALSIYEHLQTASWPFIENAIYFIQIPNLKHIIEPHTSLPFLYYYPAPLRAFLSKKLCCYINWDANPYLLTKYFIKNKYFIKIFPYQYRQNILNRHLRLVFSIANRIIKIPHGYLIIAFPQQTSHLKAT